jgi:hypothetical protein
MLVVDIYPRIRDLDAIHDSPSFVLSAATGALCCEFLMMEMRNCSVCPCGVIGIVVGVAFLAGAGPLDRAPIALDAKLPL